MTFDDWAVRVGVWNKFTNKQLNGLLPCWYVVTDDGKEIAYFSDCNEAFRFRLNYINRMLNG